MNSPHFIITVLTRTPDDFQKFVSYGKAQAPPGALNPRDNDGKVYYITNGAPDKLISDFKEERWAAISKAIRRQHPEGPFTLAFTNKRPDP